MKNYNNKFFLFVMLLLAGTFQAKAMDHLMGTITTKQGKEKVPGAIIFWEHTGIGTATDSLGNFMLAWPDSFPATLLIRSTGLKSKGIVFKGKNPSTIKVDLVEGESLETVTISEKRNASEFSFINPIMAENITTAGLRKAACCNLSESFETNPTVDAAVTDAVSGAKKIQLLGLDGVYSQILFENLPLIRGLSSSYGLSYVPGTWIKGILITKGTGSVVNGYESIAGQLNIDLLKPEEGADKFFVNLYGNNFGRMEINAHLNRSINPNWGTTLLTHASTLQMRNDHNHDGFLDMPTYTQYNVLNRWNWLSKGPAQGEFGARFVYDDKNGGQKSFNKSRDYGGTQFYGIGITNKQAEVFNKTGFVFNAPGRSIGTMFSARLHDEDMFFGIKTYKAEQKSIYVNTIYQDIIGNTNHVYKTGLSFIYDNYREKYNDSAFNREEIVPGIFAEYTGHLSTKFTVVAGARADFHSTAGFQFTPRLHIKYDLTSHTAIRISGGKGFRTSNIFTENSGVFASSRQLIVEEALKAEIAWNYGGSIQQQFKFMKNDATFIVDFFRTDFVNQVILNMETPGLLKISNLHGLSYANSFQADLSLKPMKQFDVRLAYKYYEVKTTYDGVLKQKPLTPSHRAFINLAYATAYDKWTFDFTTKWMGPSRLPESFTNAGHQSPSYFVLGTNITRKFIKFDIYGGVENILNYMQENPILGANDPFGPHFDASQVYGPTDGRVIYAGLRFKI
ncbi:TonB-dependent receptor plug domain-containing protein [soil metagenome]